MIPIQKLIEIRHDLSLVQYKCRCFALLLLDDACDAPLIEQSIAQVNKYSPQRVHITHQLHVLAYASILAVEMHYCSNIQQTYFTYLVWTWSQRVPAWMHVGDTIEHDALRRDFDVPHYMDSEFAANRMFIRNGEAFLVNVGYSPENPHGELVAEISMETAAHALYAGHVDAAPATTAAMAAIFCSPDAQSHFINHVSDVQAVQLPRSYTHALAAHPYLLMWSRDVDLAHVDLAAIAADLDPKDEGEYTVAMPNTPTGPPEVPEGMTVSEYASICIKSNIVEHYGAEMIRGEAPGDVFSSQYLMDQLRVHGWSTGSQTAQKVGGEYRACVQDWSQPVSFIPAGEQKQDADGIEEKSVHVIENIFQKVGKELDEEISTIDEKGGTGAGDGLYAGDVNMDDFMEFYAKNYLKMTDEELASHRMEPDRDSIPDWSAYNDDSDYASN